MKQLFTIALITAATTVYAQPKIISQAFITTNTTIVAPENDEEQSRTFTSDDGQIRTIRFGGGGDSETKTTTWLKDDLVKTYSESEIAVTTVIRDNSKKITTTIMEMMGKKTGFYATDEDQAEMHKRMDSMMQSRGGQNISFGGSTSAPVYSISYIDESKKISGYTCKKAFVIGTRSNGKSDTTTVWYCPDFKFQSLPSTGGSAGGFGGFNVTAESNGMEALAGFPMQYERTMNRGRKMTVQVTKLVIDKEVKAKEFDIPKDIEIKPLKEMQNGAGPGFQFRIAGQ